MFTTEHAIRGRNFLTRNSGLFKGEVAGIWEIILARIKDCNLKQNNLYLCSDVATTKILAGRLHI